jgi:16S rRNA (uracil1498-N3)-methyltransferase
MALPRRAAAVTRRYYVEPGVISADAFDLPELAHRVRAVMRLRAGDEIILFDGTGTDVRVRIASATGRNVSVRLIERVPGPPESPVRIHLYQSITKGERFEWLIEKATELGVSRIIAIETARSVVRPAREGQRPARWRRIAVEAAEQCGRSHVPGVEGPLSFADALASAPGVVLVPYESAGERASGISAALASDIDTLFALSEISILIGPEGGFEESEVEAAHAAGARVVTLGRRVLRSETAGLVALTLAMHAVGELG